MRPLLALALSLCAAPALAADPAPLRTGVDGTFAPHAIPKLGGGFEGFQTRPVHRGRQGMPRPRS